MPKGPGPSLGAGVEGAPREEKLEAREAGVAERVLGTEGRNPSNLCETEQRKGKGLSMESCCDCG